MVLVLVKKLERFWYSQVPLLPWTRGILGQPRVFSAKQKNQHQSWKKLHAAHALHADIFCQNWGHFGFELNHICFDCIFEW